MQKGQDVVRMYNVLPAIEQTKILIIERLKVLFDGVNLLFQNKILGKKDNEIIALVKATAISLYLLLIGLTYVKYIYCKARGYKERAESLYDSLMTYLLPITLTFQLIKKIYDALPMV